MHILYLSFIISLVLLLVYWGYLRFGEKFVGRCDPGFYFNQTYNQCMSLGRPVSLGY